MTSIGLLGTGVVGRTLAARFVELGLDVCVGARRADSETLAPFAALGVRTGSFADAITYAPLVVNATNGLHSVAALGAAGAKALAGTTIIDVSNELQPVSKGFPRPLATADDSLGQRIQRAFPEANVVKTLNTMNCTVMVDPSSVPGDHVAFLSGDDAAAKQNARDLLTLMGWREEQLVDLGGIDSAAAVEMTMALWMRVTVARGQGAPRFNWAING